MPNKVKTYDRSDDPEDHLKIFQAVAKVERWAMPTWCHMFNSTLTGSARREGESREDFVQRFIVESRHVKGAPECMRIFGFMHGITNPELIKRLHDNNPKSIDEMMRVTIVFLRGEVAASNQARKKAPPTWKQQEVGRKQNFDIRRNFRNQQKLERRRDKFKLLIKSPKEILALDKGKFKAQPPMTTFVEKRNSNKFYEFHGEVGHNTECMHLKRQIEELIKNGKLSHVIKELNQGSEKDQPKTAKKGETSRKDKPLAILMAPSESEKPNDSSYRTPHWLQWRNHMANGTNIAVSKNRRCRAFHLYMDEFCGSKITVSIQWDHRKARSD
ncbi:hypothetical protein Tco_1312796 [Tanacetum coccineum]